MDKNLEQLLNSLVKLGWKPYGISRVKNVTLLNRYVSFSKRTILGIEFFEYTLRSLASKESGLWQFVCENRKRGYTMPQGWIKNPKICNEGIESVEKECNQNSYEYYIIESSLKDDSELEDFLLSNIVIKDE